MFYFIIERCFAPETAGEGFVNFDCLLFRENVNKREKGSETVFVD